MVMLLTVLHVIFCLFLILVILLQTGKGAGMGVAFGGASNTVFGPRGAGSFIGKATAIVAALFMVTSLLLAWFSSSRSTGIAEKAGALADKRSSEVEEVDISKELEESALPEDGESKPPEPEPAPAIADGGAGAAVDAGALTDDAGAPSVASPAEADETVPEPEPESPPAGDAGAKTP